jgi:hypothetical protein
MSDKKLKPIYLKPNKSYALVLDEENNPFVSNLIQQHLITLNLNEGYRRGKNLLGKYFLVDNKEEPTDDYFVLSFKKRDKRLFKNYSLDEHGLELLVGYFKIEDQGILTYINRYMRRKPLEVVYKYLLAQAGGGLDFEAFKTLVKSKEYESLYYYKEKFLIVLRAIAKGTPHDVIKLRQMVLDEDMLLDDIVNFIVYVQGAEVPDYLKEDVESLKTKRFYQRRDKLLLFLVDVSSLERLYHFLICK